MSRKQYKKVKNRLYRFKRMQFPGVDTYEYVAVVSADCEQAARLTLCKETQDYLWASTATVKVDMIARESLCPRGLITSGLMKAAK